MARSHIVVGAYLRMIDGVYAALEGVEEHWGVEYDGDYRFRWVHSYWCAAAVVYYLYRFFEPLKSWHPCSHRRRRLAPLGGY